jgi:ribosomal protein S18 acetylase RimI-like enzyme
MRIRRLAPTDAPAYRALRLRGLREHPEAFSSSFEEDVLMPLSTSENRLATGDDHSFWGAFDGPQPDLRAVVGLERERRAKNRHKGRLVGLYVVPECAGRGIGRALVDAAVGHARASGLRLIVLSVTEANRAAIALYQRAGFKSFGLEPRAIQVDGRFFAKHHMALELPLP